MRWRTMLVVVVALLAISAMPASAQNASSVASEHTTFGTADGETSPTALQNMSVTGSGDSASVRLESRELEAGFESGDLSGWTGDTGSFDVVSSPTYNGDYALGFTSDGTVSITRDLGSNAYTSVAYTVNDQSISDLYPKVRLIDDGSAVALTVIDGGSYTDDPGSVAAYNDSGYIDTGIDITTGSWYQIVYEDIDYASQTYEVAVYNESGQVGSSDPISFANSASDIDDLEISTSFSDPFYIDDILVSTPPASAQYVGAAHDADGVTAGYTNLTLSDATADITWQQDADGDGTWTNVTSATISSTTNITQDLSGVESDRWRARVDIEATGSDPVAEIHDEGLLFESSSPILSDSEPPDEMKIQNATGNVSINVSDADFGLAQGESATVSATDDDGTSLGSTTLPSNGTASFSYSSEAGENIIEWTATDAYGNTETFTQTFTTPEMLYIRPEGDPGALVSGPNVSIEVRFYSQDQIYTRTTSDGSVSLAGLPADARFAVVVSAEGYYRRRVIIDSLFEQQSVYLLNESHPAVEKQFVLNDVSANFPADSTRIYIQRSINNSTTYRTVAADYFGATSSFATFLKTDQRYRIIIENDQGDRRTLGSYTPVAAGVEPLKIEGVGLYQESQDGYIANASTRMVTDTQRQVVVRYRDPAAATSDYTVQIYERGNESNVTYTEQVTGPVENYSAYVDVKNNTNYVVNWSATRNGQQIGGVRPVGGGDLGLRIPLPDQWLGTIGLVIIVFVGSLAGERYATHLALSVVAFAGVLMYLAVIDIFLPLWWASLLIAAGGHLAQRRPAA